MLPAKEQPVSFKPESNCKWCKRVKADKELFNRLNRSKEYVPSGEALSVIAKEIDPGGYRGLINHVKKHQAPKPSYLKRDTEARETKKALQDIKLAETKRQVGVLSNQAEMRKELLQKGMEAFEKGDIKMGMSHIVTMLGQEQKAEEAAKDRGLEVMKMFKYFNAQAGNPRDYAKYSEEPVQEEPIEGEVV